MTDIDYAELTLDELQDRSLHGDEAAELEHRRRTLTPLRTTVTLCADCGETIISDTVYRRNEDGTEWSDPFAAYGVAMFVNSHRFFCTARRRWRRQRSSTRTYTATVNHRS